MGYKYQMHTHTFPASDCGAMEPEELAHALYIGGYSGCVLTNHFYWGNTGIGRNMPWEKFVSLFTDDYYRAVEAAKEWDIDIIFGLEEHIGSGLEILCYGITPEILLAHPELCEMGVERWHSVMGSCGGLCIQAHPFRSVWYIDSPGLLDKKYIDGFEVYNACNCEEDNNSALSAFGENLDMIVVSGADAHTTAMLCIGGIETEQRIRTGKELVGVLRSGKYKILK